MLIAINGEANSGKTTVADWISKRNDLVKISFADPMKRFIRQLFGVPAENLWGPSDMREAPMAFDKMMVRAFSQLHTMHQFPAALYPEERGVDIRVKAFDSLQQWFTSLKTMTEGGQITARVMLQTLGDWGQYVSPNTWIDYLFKRQLPLLAEGYSYTPELGIRLNEGKQEVKSGICIPDARYPSEMVECRTRNGYLLRVRRKGYETTSQHRSEHAMKNIEDNFFAYVIEAGPGELNAEIDKWEKSPGFPC